jgi:hypothetical protein
MKIGFVVECSPKGPDDRVMRAIMKVFRPTDTLMVSPMLNKGKLLAEAPDEVFKLLKGGCDRVFVTWDWHPLEARWKNTVPKRWRPGVCRQEAHELRQKLDAKNISADKAILTVVTQELEAWALADHEAIREIIARRRNRSVEGVRRTAKPELHPNPERHLENMFRKFNVELVKHSDVPAILEYATRSRFKRLKSCPSFVRLVEKLTGRAFAEAVEPGGTR